MKDRRLVVMTGPGLSAGWALAGVDVVEATDGIDAARRIEHFVDAGNAGVVILDESLYGELPEDFWRSLNRSPFPVVIPVPGPDWTAESSAHEYVVGILRRAIGYRVRL